MKESLKRVWPSCLGSSIGVMAVQLFTRPGTWSPGRFLATFAITFVFTTVIVALISWIIDRIRKK